MRRFCNRNRNLMWITNSLKVNMGKAKLMFICIKTDAIENKCKRTVVIVRKELTLWKKHNFVH